MGITKWWMDFTNPGLTVKPVQQLEIVKAYSYPCNCGYSLIYPVPEIDCPAVIKCDNCGSAYSMTWKGDHFLSRPVHEDAIPDGTWLRFKEKYAEQLKPKTPEQLREFSVGDGGFGKPPEL
jgi:hypothetical protein